MHLLYFYLLSLILFLLFLSKRSRRNLPPSPWKLPLIGNFHQLGLAPHRSLRSLAQKYGPLLLLHFGQVPVLIISSAAAAREILRTHDQKFSSRPKSRLAKRLIYDSRDVVFSPYGEHWREARSIGVLNLLSNRRVQSFRNVREEEAAAMIEMIRNCSSWVNLSEMFTLLSGNIVCRVVLGKKYVGEGGGRRLKVMLDRLSEFLGSLNVGEYISWLAWLNSITGFDAKANKLAKEVDEFLTEVVEEHTNKKDRTEKGKIENEGKQDFVDCLLDIQGDKTRPINGDITKAITLVKLKFLIFP
ncbi:hypothetical protein NMG60_11004529 [Bertholletia excelsa]